MRNFRSTVKFKGGENMKIIIKDCANEIIDGRDKTPCMYDIITFEWKHFKEVTNLDISFDMFLNLRDGWFAYAIQPELYPVVTENLPLILKELI